jgi:phosphoserine phosphatase RsbU/P
VGTPGGLPLGLFDDCEAAPERVVLAAGDALVLCTDGVTEARRGQEEFGHGRLHDILRSVAGSTAEAIAESILQEIEAFRDGQARDDTALLVIRARP